MLFNSIDFALFLPIVFGLYWFVFNRNLKLQNLLIVVASYVFYGWWDWRFLSLILFSTIIDFSVGVALDNTDNSKKRKGLLWISIIINLGLLCFFKYYNFFLDNFIEAFSILGYQFKASSLNIILPVGISFYTFQTMSYTIDVYRKKLEPTKDFIAFSAFVSFFPQLVAGPIERATNLLPQFYSKRVFEYHKIVDGMRQILWGLFKKVVIADNCAYYVDFIFNGAETYSSSTLILGAVLFTFQAYGDFSGYSDIAIGTARLFGFNLLKNFNFPYFSRDVSEFWGKWHISLSTWFRDYIYIPLGGSKKGKIRKAFNILFVFLISGLWHGANWNYVFWGFINAVYYIPFISKNNQFLMNQGTKLNSKKFWDSIRIVKTYVLITFAWIFFRADNIHHAFSYILGFISPSFFSFPEIFPKTTLLFLVIFCVIEWNGKNGEYAIEKFGLKWKRPFRHLFYYFIIFSILWLGGKSSEFIYFKF